MKDTTALSLFAEWSTGEEPHPYRPDRVYWSDGTPATQEDYLAHKDCTSVDRTQGDRIILQMFPGIIADLRYDNASGRWRVSGSGVEPFNLHLSDPNALDEQLIAELSTCPIDYQVRILRD